MGMQALVLKLLEGITDVSIRTSITTALSAMIEMYRLGRISDDELKRDLVLFCTDVLAVKHPLKDVEELRAEAEQWAEQLFRAIKIEIIRDRYLSKLSTGL